VLEQLVHAAALLDDRLRLFDVLHRQAGDLLPEQLCGKPSIVASFPNASAVCASDRDSMSRHRV
jgi:hypothetical protein